MNLAATVKDLEPALRTRINTLIEEGRDIFHEFDLEVRQRAFHPFVPANYDKILARLLDYREPGLRFLEWGSGTGIITIMADMLGFEAYGIEMDPELVRVARGLAAKYDSNAKFAAGTFLPMGYAWKDATGDNRLGTLGGGVSAYAELKHPLEDFHIVYGYPWDGEAAIMQDVMRAFGGPDSRLIVHGSTDYEIYQGQRRQLSAYKKEEQV